MKLRLLRLTAAAVLAVAPFALAACGGGYQCDDVASNSADLLADDCGDDD